jgi:3-methylfumaryl-CoA hydratase
VPKQNPDGRQHLMSWVGSTVEAEDFVDAGRCRRLIATLGLESVDLGTGASLPILWHWLYFLEATDGSHTGPDGHPVRGGFLPPIQLRRRMFAGGRTELRAPLEIGMHVTRTSVVERIEHKTGSTGDLVVVAVRHTVRSGTELLVEERQDLVYTDARPAAGQSENRDVADAPFARDIETDEVMLFRFSALTFNSHRIHYDRTYAQSQEGYPDLVVHGPLTAVCLADVARSATPDPVSWFEFRARAPIHVGETIRIRGQHTDNAIGLNAYRDDGMRAVTASAGS